MSSGEDGALWAEGEEFLDHMVETHEEIEGYDMDPANEFQDYTVTLYAWVGGASEEYVGLGASPLGAALQAVDRFLEQLGDSDPAPTPNS